MATDDKDTDLISQVIVEGIDAATAQLKDYGDAGARAWDQIANAAKAAGAVASRTGAQISNAFGKVQAQFKKLGTTQIISKENAAALKDIRGEFEKFGASLGRTTQAVGRFSQRFALLATGATAAGVAFTVAAGRIAKEVDGTSDAIDRQTKAQQDANTAYGEAATRQINFRSNLRQLQGALARGEITYTEYNAAVQKSVREENEAIRVARELKAVQDDVADANERLAKSAADRKAYQGLVDTFGGPLTSSLVAFGRQVNKIRKEITDAFGPGLATLVDAVSNTLTANGGRIASFFSDLGAQVEKLAKENAPELREALENLGAAAGAVFRGLLVAAPQLLRIFNDGLVPAVKAIAAAFNGLADLVNSVFGTKLTGGTLAAVAAFLQFSGLLRLLPRLIGSLIPLVRGLATVMFLLWRNITPVGIAITALIAGIAYLQRTSPAFQKFTAEGRKAMGQLVSSFTTTLTSAIAFVGRIGTTLMNAWRVVESGATTAVTSIQSAFTSVGSFFSGIWSGITTAASDAWKMVTDAANTAYTAIVAFWQPIGDFFAALWLRLSTDGMTVWNGYKAIASIVAQNIITAWNAVLTFFTGLWGTLSSGAQAAWDAITAGVEAAVTFVTDTWQGLVDFLQTVWDGITGGAQAVWDAIVAGFQSAINTVTGFFQRLLNAALEYLKPIIDMLKMIVSLSGASGSAAGSTGVQRAGGGMVTGPGTSTSDSIPAWLSNNEFVVRAKAVRKYGASMLRAINEGRFNPGSIAAFAQGGLVGAMASGAPSYAFADTSRSGYTGPRTTLNLTIDGQDFNGLLAPDDVASKLTTHAIKKRTVRAGRQPGWRGGR